jgi:peptidoglycan hydrolase CwlO-like protein
MVINVKKLLMSFLVLLALLLMFQPVIAAEDSSLGDVKNSADQALQNASKATNDTAQDVQKTLGPIQDILNTISSIIQQIQQIFQDLSYIMGGGSQ